MGTYPPIQGIGNGRAVTRPATKRNALAGSFCGPAERDFFFAEWTERLVLQRVLGLIWPSGGPDNNRQTGQRSGWADSFGFAKAAGSAVRTGQNDTTQPRPAGGHLHKRENWGWVTRPKWWWESRSG